MKYSADTDDNMIAICQHITTRIIQTTTIVIFVFSAMTFLTEQHASWKIHNPEIPEIF